MLSTISALISPKGFNLRAGFLLGYSIRLPHLEYISYQLPVVVLSAGLLCMMRNPDSLALHRVRVESQRDQDINCWRNPRLQHCLVRDHSECPRLLNDELYYLRVATHNLIALVGGGLEELRLCKPLLCNFVSIVCANELVIVYAVWRISKYPVAGWMAAVQFNDIVDKGLACRREGKGRWSLWVAAIYRGLLWRRW